jgi:dTDP-4-dehydrorhamnose reductase
MILILGAGGQVSSALKDLLGDAAIVWGREQIDFENLSTFREKILKLKPTVVINAAAYTKVDKAEVEEALAFKVNAESPFAIAQACYQIGAVFLTYSTDYVYSGEGTSAWKESDPVAPKNAYGRSKAAGESLIFEWAPQDFKYLIIRTSWVFSFIGQNFVRTMLRLGGECEVLKVVADQIGAPTYAPHLAEITLELLTKLKSGLTKSGIYNASNSGETSWFGFAQEIFLEAAKLQMPLKVKKVDEIASSSYPTPAKRPQNSRLCQDKLVSVLGHQSPHWKVGLQQCLWQIKSSK